jgi:hypothetical protein
VLSGVVELRYLFVGTSPLRIVVRVLSTSHGYLMIPSIRVDAAISDSHTTLAGGDGGIVAYYELVAVTGKDELRTLSLVAAPTVVVLRIAGACIQPVTVPVSVSTTCSSSLALGQGSEMCCDFWHVIDATERLLLGQ